MPRSLRSTLAAAILLLLPADHPAGAEASGERCTNDGAHCIRLESAIADTCATIEAAASRHDLDVGFLARLLWRESRFDPAAISPAGAQGIAQFIPATARRRGLVDAFNPAEAIFASAEYLAELADEFGNVGLAAIAYNAGERRAARILADPAAFLPSETLAYVPLITGHPARDWAEPPVPRPDLRLDQDRPFAEACVALAANRTIREFRAPSVAAPPWGVIVAAGRRRDTVERLTAKIRDENRAILEDRGIAYVHAAVAGFGRRPRYTAQIAADGRDDAQALCRRLRENGAFCQVNRN